MLRRALKALFHWTIALLILFEEWGWVPLANALARLGRLPVFRWVERSIRARRQHALRAGTSLQHRHAGHQWPGKHAAPHQHLRNASVSAVCM